MNIFMHRRAGLFFFCAVAALLFSESAHGQVQYEAQKLFIDASDVTLGYSVSVSEDWLLVGRDLGGGTAYFFRWDGTTWVYGQVVQPLGGISDFVGESVAIEGDKAVVSARVDNENGHSAGAVYAYRWNGSSWVQVQKLLAMDGDEDDQFGGRVSMSGDVLLVGAAGDEDDGSFSGSAYVFQWNGSSWDQQQKLLASGDPAYFFGSSVSIRGNVAVIGSLGAAYVFRWSGSTWVQEGRLVPADQPTPDGFGGPVSVFEDVAVVGALSDDDNGPSSGSAYAFRFVPGAPGSWEEDQKLLPTDGEESDRFGTSVSVFGDVIVCGAQLDRNNGIATGSAYVFRWNGSSWIEAQKLLASDGGNLDTLGVSLVVSEDLAFVGAPRNDEGGSLSGAVYIFNLSCDTGLYGPMCLECPGGAANACNGHGMCDDGVDGTGVCACDAGWTGMDCATDLDECAEGLDNCHLNAACSNTPGSFSCACNPGFTGDGVTCQSGDIPTVSGWGLVVLALVMLVGGKVGFRNRQSVRGGS